jgi:hypothetical protein
VIDVPPNDKHRHHALASRIRLFDLLVGVFIPASVASAWPAFEPQQRAVVFGCMAILSCASVWWAASLAFTYGVTDSPRRLALHLYSFVAVLSFAIFIPTAFFVGIGFIFRLFFINATGALAGDGNSISVLTALIILGPTALMTISLIGVEYSRIQRAAADAPVEAVDRPKVRIIRIPAARPSPAPAIHAAEPETPRRKKRKKKRRMRLRNHAPDTRPQSFPTPPLPI